MDLEKAQWETPSIHHNLQQKQPRTIQRNNKKTQKNFKKMTKVKK